MRRGERGRIDLPMEVLRVTGLLQQISTQHQNKEGPDSTENQAVLLVPRHRIGAKPILLVLGKPSDGLRGVQTEEGSGDDQRVVSRSRRSGR